MKLIDNWFVVDWRKKLNNFELLWIFKNYILVFINYDIKRILYEKKENYFLINSLFEIFDYLVVDYFLGNGDMEVWC